MARLIVRGLLTDSTTGGSVPGFNITINASVEATYNVRTRVAGARAAVVFLQPIDDDLGSDDPPFEHFDSTGSVPPITITTGSNGEFEQQINMAQAERDARSIEDYFNEEGLTFTGGINTYRVRISAQRPSGAVVTAASAAKGPRAAGFPLFEFNSLRVPRRRIIILDLDGLRWDVFRRHLKNVRDKSAGLDRTHRFEPRYDATRNTVIGEGKDLLSGLAFLCFGEQMGRAEVRLARAPYPSYTLPSHATMFTGFWPNLHGIAGNAYVRRDAVALQWKHRDWEKLPDGPALQGYCTGADDILTGIDYWWDGLDEADDDDCADRNRGLVSDLPDSITVYHRAASAASLRSTVIHNFYHGATRPWTDAGKDVWWHMTNPEVRSAKDVCSGDDADQLETADSAAFVKAELLLSFQPHSIRVPSQGPYPYPTADFNYSDLVEKLSGEKNSLFSRLQAQTDAAGGPDIITVYFASIDTASHKKGTPNQATYLAWFDHRLALFVKELINRDPFRFNNTVFAIVSDHGHVDLVNEVAQKENALAVREEICRIAFGEDELERLRVLSQQYPYLSYPNLLEDMIEDVAAVFPQGQNLYVYLRDTSAMNPESVARALLALTLNVTPTGAFIRAGEEYRFLRLDTAPIPINEEECRNILSSELDVPVATQDSEVAEVALDDRDREDEQRLRTTLRASAPGGGTYAFDLLNVAGRVRGLGPRTGTAARRSPDIILIAPSQQSFTSGKAPTHARATHGALSYPVTRVPMMFFGRPIDGVFSIPQADMVDFTPTVLSLLGIDSAPFQLDGQPLVTYDGRPIVRPGLPIHDGVVPSTEVVITGPTQRPTRRAAANLTVFEARDVQPADVAPEVPWTVLLTARFVNRRIPKLIDDGTTLYEFDSGELNVLGLTAEPTWTIDGVGQARGRSHRVQLRAAGPGPAARTRLSVRMTAGDLVQNLWLPRVLAVRLLSLELPALPAWLQLLAQRARKLIVPLRFEQSKLPGAASAEGFLTNVLLDVDTFLALVTQAGARADGARILAAENAVLAAVTADPAQAATALTSAWASVKVATRTSRSHSVEAYDAAIESLRAVAMALPVNTGAAVLDATASLRTRVLKFQRPRNDGEKMETAVRILQRVLQSREMLVMKMPGVHQGL